MKFIMTGQYGRMIWLSCVVVFLSQSFIVISPMKSPAKPPAPVAAKPVVAKPAAPVVAKPAATAAKPAASTPTTAKPATPAATATKAATPTAAGTKAAAKPGDPAAKPGDPAKSATPGASSTAKKTPTPTAAGTKAPAKPGDPAVATEAKPSMFAGLASKVGGAASMAGGLASNPMAAAMVGMVSPTAGAMLANPAAAAAALVSKVNPEAGALVGMAAGAAGIGAPAPAEAPVADASAEAPVAAAEAPVAAAEAPAAVVDAPADLPAAVVDAPAVAKAVVVESDEGTDAVVKPPVAALATKKPSIGKPVPKPAQSATASKKTTATGLFIQGLMATLKDKSVDFNAETLIIQFTVGAVKCEASIKFGFAGFGDPDKPFEEATAKLEASVPDAVKTELAPLLAIKPAEVFVLKLILMLNSANKAAAVDAAKDFDVDDMILINLPMLLRRLEQTDNNAYATSSQAAFDAVRPAFKPLFELVKFPENHWYERAVTDMPDGKPTEFMHQISKMRWQSGFKARTKALESQILPLLTAERNPLEKAFFAYAITMHLQEYDGGFIDTDKPDYVKPIIDSRIEMLKPVLQKAIDAMGVAKMDAAVIKKAQDFLVHSDDKSRVAGGKADGLIPLQIPAVAVPGLKGGVKYFISIVDRFMRHHIIHPKLLGDADCIPFDFAFDHDSLLESLVALNMRMVQGSAPKVLSQMLADIYFRASDESVDAMIARMAAINGLLDPAVQPAVDAAKKGAADDEEFEDDIVMDIEDLPAAAAAA